MQLNGKVNLQARKQALWEADKEVRQTKQHITTLQRELSEISAEIESKRRERDRLHGEVGKYKEAIAFQMEAVDLWTMFLTATEDADVETEFLRKIVAKVTKKQNWNIFGSDGMKLVEASFLEAWGEVETTAQETGSYHKRFLIERRALAKHLSPWFHSVIISCTVSIGFVY